MSARSRQSGFTLVELMFVVVIVSILAMALAPSVRRTLMEQKLATAARDLVRIIRDARQNAVSTRLAHLVHVNPAATPQEVRVVRGVTSSCVTQNWTARNAYCNGTASARHTGLECLVISMGHADYALPGSTEIRLSEWTDSGSSAVARSICFAPNGLTYHAQKGIGENPLVLANNVGGGFLFQVAMRRLGAPASEQDNVPPLQVLVPTNGFPRIVR